MSELHYEDIDEFIKNYIEKDRSGRAIMLTSGWGTGKSYYIKKELKNYLEEYGCKCVVVSLYGLTDISEISKAIYVELRTIGFCDNKKSKSEFKETAKVFGKTILNGFISKIGVDFGKLDEELQKVYESIDLSDKLIIFEDIERTEINMVELLGYVNGLCEGDGYKVMLVASEREILKEYTYIPEHGSFGYQHTKSAAKYIKAKEKTVGDTIKFRCDHKYTVKAILAEFGLCYNEKEIGEMVSVMADMNSYNMRSFQYACQKYCEIKEKLKNVYELDKKQDTALFHNIIAYIQMRDRGEGISFPNGAIMSSSINKDDKSQKYHLFRFAYDYIEKQRFDKDEAKRQLECYSAYCSGSKWNMGKDDDLNVIKDFTWAEEKELRDAIANIPEKIKNGDITYWDYCDLLASLMNIEVEYDHEIDTEYKNISQLMIERLQASDKKDELKADGLYQSVTVVGSFEGEFKDILFEFEEAIGYHERFEADEKAFFDMLNNGLWVSEVKKTIEDEGFSSVFDIDFFCLMMEKSTAKQLCSIFNILDGSYSVGDINRIDEDTYELKRIRDKAEQQAKDKYNDLISKKHFEDIYQNIDALFRFKTDIEKAYKRKQQKTSAAAQGNDLQEKVENEIERLAETAEV